MYFSFCQGITPELCGGGFSSLELTAFDNSNIQGVNINNVTYFVGS